MAYKYSRSRPITVGGQVILNQVTTDLVTTTVVTAQSTILNRLNISSSYDLNYTHYFIGIDTVNASSSITVNLPQASGSTAGRSYVIKDEGGNADVNNIIIQASGSDTIDGLNAVYIESPYASMNVYTDGVSKWFIY
jgi:hypothetical protein